MGQNRNWSAAEKEYLRENWGSVSVIQISKNLNRSINAINVMKDRLGLGAFLEAGDYITLNQLMKAVVGHQFHSYHMKSWVENRGLPIHYRRVGKMRVRVVYLDEFWAWAEKNRAFLDFSKMEPLALGAEPDWVKEQRSQDFRSFYVQRKDRWTSAEDSRLIALLKLHKYGYAELSKMLHRSEGAIQRRCADLGIKERPVRKETHGADSVWTEEHFRVLADGIRNGESYAEIGRKLGKSEKAVRGKVYVEYLTESADKVRAMMGSGEWGSGAPIPTVKQARSLSSCRSDVKRDLTKLVTILRMRMNELGFDPYWQRFMCMNWDDVGGCLAGCANCDDCVEFRRIRPQYCARCGNTFYEREENRFCEKCRKARKKAAQRKWKKLHPNAQRKS